MNIYGGETSVRLSVMTRCGHWEDSGAEPDASTNDMGVIANPVTKARHVLTLPSILVLI